MAAKDEDGNVHADATLAETSEIDQYLDEVSSNLLRYQAPPVHEVESNQDEKKETTDTSDSCSLGVDRSIKNITSDQDTSNEQGTSTNQLADSSTTSNVPVTSGEAALVPSSSDITNIETKRVPITPGKKVTLLRRPMADVVKRSLRLSLKPIKNDPSLRDKSFAIREQLGDADLASKYNLPDDEEVTNPIDYYSSDYDIVRNQLQEHFSLLSVENDNDAKELTKIDFSSASNSLEAEHDHPLNPAQAPPKPSLQRQNAMRQQRYTRELDPGYSASYLNQPMPTRQSITTLLQEHFSLLSIANNDSEELSKIDSSSSDHVEAEQAHYETHEPFGVRQHVNPTQAPSKPSLQRQNAMRQQRYTRELDPGYSASSLNQPMPTRQSITTASSHRPSVSMTNALTRATDFVPMRNQQSMNPHYSECQVPSGQYGNITNSPYTPPNQKESYNMAPSAAAAFQQLGGSNNNSLAHYGSIMNDSYNMPPQSAASTVPYDYGSVNSFGMSSNNNLASSTIGYEAGVSRNHLSSVQQHQSGDSNVLPPISIRSRQQRQKLPWNDFSVSPKPTKR